MSVFASPHFLPRVLLADSASGFGCGALQLLFTAALAQWFNLPAALVLGTGWFLLAYGAFAAFVGTRRPVPRGVVWLLVVGNLGWSLACVALVFGSAFQPSQWGAAYVLFQAAFVLVMAELQWSGLRHAPAGGLAAA